MRRIRIRKNPAPSHDDAVYSLGYIEGKKEEAGRVAERLALLDEMIASEIDYRKLRKALENRTEELALRYRQVDQFIFHAMRNNKYGGLGATETDTLRSQLSQLGKIIQECRKT